MCEAAPARLFCAADEAALCLKCDEKVLQSRWHSSRRLGFSYDALFYIAPTRMSYWFQRALNLSHVFHFLLNMCILLLDSGFMQEIRILDLSQFATESWVAMY